MTCNLFFKKMLVLDDIVLMSTSEGVMATQTDHRQPVKQSILTQLLFCWCATWLDNWVTEQHASCHAIAFSLFEPYRAPADITLLTQPQRVWNAGSVSESIGLVYWVSSCYGLGLYLSRQLGSPAHVQHIPPAEAQESHREKRNQREIAERERDRAEGENSRELRGGGLWFYLHLQPSSHK